MGGSNARILNMFPGCCGLDCSACRRGALGDVRSGQSVHDGDVPRKAATFPPRDQCKTIWSLTTVIISKDGRSVLPIRTKSVFVLTDRMIKLFCFFFGNFTGR